MIKDKRNIPILVAYIFLAILFMWLFYALTMALNISSSEKIGQWGDSFGAINSLFAGLAFASTVVAIIVSFNAIQKATENTETQIKVGKIEEIFEIVSYLHYHYIELKFLYGMYRESNEIAHNSKPKLVENYENRLESFKKSVDISRLEKSIHRLNLLSNTYLKGELRLKTLAIEDMFQILMLASLHRQIIYKEMFYETGFPDTAILSQFLDSLKTELVQEISMGGKYTMIIEMNEYRKNVFKPELGIS